MREGESGGASAGQKARVRGTRHRPAGPTPMWAAMACAAQAQSTATPGSHAAKFRRRCYGGNVFDWLAAARARQWHCWHGMLLLSLHLPTVDQMALEIRCPGNGVGTGALVRWMRQTDHDVLADSARATSTLLHVHHSVQEVEDCGTADLFHANVTFI